MERDFPFSDDRRPLGYLGRVPLTVSNLIICANGAFLLSLLIAASTQGGHVLGQVSRFLQLEPRAVIEHFEAWRLLTYPLAEDAWGVLCTVVAMGAYYVAGNEVEQYLGRRVYTLLLVALWFVPSAFIVALYPFEPVANYGGALAFYMSVAFAATVLYPTSEVFMRIEARWLGAGMIALALLMALAYREWTLLLALTVSFLTCFVVLRRLGHMHTYMHTAWGAGNAPYENEGYHNRLARDFQRDQERMRKLASMEPHSYEGVGTRSKIQHAVAQERLVEEEPEDPYDVIDPLLEKISQHGLEGLTAAERTTLENARLRIMESERK
jgi:membrane associated rhomboid family serine protease